MYDALRKEHELLKRSVPPSTPRNQAVIPRPNPYAFAPSLNGFDDIRPQPSGLSGKFSPSLLLFYLCFSDDEYEDL